MDYNPGRYIRLEPLPSPHTDIRDFRADLRACTDDAVSGEDPDDQYSEQKFLQVKRIIERFRGREGQTEADRRWTRFVTDVRNWFTFAASERYREDDTEYEHYADSGGKSGGQKEKLAYTILAASLAYQFKLEWGAAKSRTFRFAVIDEAFGRGSDESTRFALELFGRLGLQLLIVTPLQKIHVIEPYVSAVGFVDNPTSTVLAAADAHHRGVPAPSGSRTSSGDRGCDLVRGGLTWRSRGPAPRMSARGAQEVACACWPAFAAGAGLGSRSVSRPRPGGPPRSASASPTSRQWAASGTRAAPAARCAWSTSRSAAGTSGPTASRPAPGSTATTRPGQLLGARAEVRRLDRAGRPDQARTARGCSRG